MKDKRLIYSLCCPITDEIHYIGKTTQGMTRPMQHLTKSHSDKINEWVDNLKQLGHKPKIKILEYVPITENLDAHEKHWIQESVNKGDLLLNDMLITPVIITPAPPTELDKIVIDNNTVNQTISAFLKERRKSVNLTQEQFAQKAGVALTVVRKIEQGKTNIALDGFIQILKMFGCTIGVKKK